jgi:hypothetical protein
VTATALALALALAAPAADPYEEEVYVEEHHERVRISALGGTLWNRSDEGSEWVTLAGGQIAMVRDGTDLGVQVQGYKGLELRRPDTWAPVVLARFEQRFVSGRGFDGQLALGLGAARRIDWQFWYQFALGVRVPLGPAHLGAEIGFEQTYLVRFAANLGVAF